MAVVLAMGCGSDKGSTVDNTDNQKHKVKGAADS